LGDDLSLLIANKLAGTELIQYGESDLSSFWLIVQCHVDGPSCSIPPISALSYPSDII
jgi:hypothetical protein